MSRGMKAVVYGLCTLIGGAFIGRANGWPGALGFAVPVTAFWAWRLWRTQ